MGRARDYRGAVERRGVAVVFIRLPVIFTVYRRMYVMLNAPQLSSKLNAELLETLMFVSHQREKLLNAIIYFVGNTKQCNTLKLLKLINFLDFEHFRQTGKSVTGLDYEAWKQGPVPRSLWAEFKHGPRDDLASAVTILTHKDELTDQPTRRDFRPRRKFDPKFFTKRELKIMERLAEFFLELTATQIGDYSHSRNMPWSKVYRQGAGSGQLIPYELSLSTEAVVHDMPTIDRDEFEYRRKALAEVLEHTE